MIHTLYNNRSQSVYFPGFFQNVPTLTSLKLALQPINNVGAAQLGEALAINSTMKALYLRCKIDGHGMTSLSQGLALNFFLEITASGLSSYRR
ncbi:MAG: hypothetical protein OJI67_03595 [Prosthecobacter sp.]|nr:hypothetical protein [Prosthecobacter sp.]